MRDAKNHTLTTFMSVTFKTWLKRNVDLLVTKGRKGNVTVDRLWKVKPIFIVLSFDLKFFDVFVVEIFDWGFDWNLRSIKNHKLRYSCNFSIDKQRNESSLSIVTFSFFFYLMRGKWTKCLVYQVICSKRTYTLCSFV